MYLLGTELVFMGVLTLLARVLILCSHRYSHGTDLVLTGGTDLVLIRVLTLYSHGY